MKKNISRTLLASAAALAVTLSLPTIQTFGPDHFSSTAFARGGSDDGGGSGSGSSGGGGNSGSGRSGGSDDHSGSGRGGDDHSGRGGHDDGDDDHGRGRDDGAEHDRDDDNPGERHGGRNDNRPEVTLSVSEASLTGLLNGSLAAVDQLGRRLEVEIELEDGTRVVVAHPHRGDFV